MRAHEVRFSTRVERRCQVGLPAYGPTTTCPVLSSGVRFTRALARRVCEAHAREERLSQRPDDRVVGTNLQLVEPLPAHVESSLPPRAGRPEQTWRGDGTPLRLRPRRVGRPMYRVAQSESPAGLPSLPLEARIDHLGRVAGARPALTANARRE